ncbi:MAG: hypothetical protein ABEI98_00400 [Halorhabdus sp.]
MSTEDIGGLQSSATTTAEEPIIEDPIPEFNKYGNPTGYGYFRYTGCGIEAIRRRELGDGGCKCDGGWS